MIVPPGSLSVGWPGRRPPPMMTWILYCLVFCPYRNGNAPFRTFAISSIFTCHSVVVSSGGSSCISHRYIRTHVFHKPYKLMNIIYHAVCTRSRVGIDVSKYL